jgi:hypothetical protein
MSKDVHTQFLYVALKEAQDNIRTYDTKAQIVGIGFIFTIGLLFKLVEFIEVSNGYNFVLMLVTWTLVIIPAVLFGSVLYPTRKVAPKVTKNKQVVKGLFYMNLFEVESVNDYVHKLNSMDVAQELSYELLKVSYLRDLKRKRFLQALSAASLGFLILFMIQLIPIINFRIY